VYTLDDRNVLSALVFQEALCVTICCDSEGLNTIETPGAADSSAEKDFIGPGVMDSLVDAMGLDARRILVGTGGDVDSFTSEVLRMVNGRCPAPWYALSITTMYKWSHTRRLEIVIDMRSLAPQVVPYITVPFAVGCDYCLGFKGIAHGTPLKLEVMRRLLYDADSAALLFGNDVLLQFEARECTRNGVRNATTAVSLNFHVFSQWFSLVLANVRKQTPPIQVSEDALRTAATRFEWFMKYVLNGHQSLFHSTCPYPMLVRRVCGSRAWDLPAGDDGDILAQMWTETVEPRMPAVATQPDAVNRMYCSVYNKTLGTELYG